MYIGPHTCMSGYVSAYHGVGKLCILLHTILCHAVRKLKKTSVLRVKQFYFRVVTRHVHVSTLRVTQVKMVLQLEFLNIIQRWL